MEKNTYFEARLLLPENISDELKQEILDTLKDANFTKLSYPIAAFNYAINSDKDEVVDINKTTIVGYIKKYIKKDEKFIFNIYNSLRAKIEDFSDPVVIVKFREYDGKLGVITKLIIKDNNAKVALSSTEDNE